MGKKGFILLLAGMFLFVIMGALPFTAAFAKSTPKPIVFKYVTFTQKEHPMLTGDRMFVDVLNKAAKGELLFKAAGGPEAIPAFEQGEAVKSGVIDAGIIAAAYYRPLVPENFSLTASRISFAEEQKVGYWDAIRKAHKKANMYWLRRASLHTGFRLYTKVRVKTPADFKGLKIRSSKLYDPFLKALGAVPVTINVPETYTALQRGLADGFGWPQIGAVKYGWTDVCGFMVDHSYWKTNSSFLINLDKWNSLPKHLQDLINKTALETLDEGVAAVSALEQADRKKMKEKGVEFIYFSPEDEKYYLDLAYSSLWKEVLRRCPQCNEFEPMILKK